MSFVLKSLFIQKKKYKSMSYLTSKDYFFGKISRQRAEEVLLESGGEDGRFLIRESLSSPTKFSLAVCFNGKPYHYQFKLQAEGVVKMAPGASFSNVDKMISYFSTRANGIITRLIHPCQRDIFGGAQVWPSISQSKALLYLTEAGKERCSNFEEVIRQVYRLQPWYKGDMTREESREYLLKRRNGEFVIREKSNGSLVLSLIYEGKDYHYVVEIRKCRKTGSSSYKISPGPEFDNIMELVTFYHSGGLACPLHIDYEESKASISWLKSNPAFKAHKDFTLFDEKEMSRHQKLKRLSKSLESLDISSTIFLSDNEEVMDDEQVTRRDFQNRNLMTEETFKSHDKASFGFSKSEQIQKICGSARLNMQWNKFSHFGQEQQEESQLSNHAHFNNHSPETTTITKKSRLTLEPKNKFSKIKSPVTSRNTKEKLQIRESHDRFTVEKPTTVTNKMEQQNSAPAGHDDDGMFSLNTFDIIQRPDFVRNIECHGGSLDESGDESLKGQKDLLPPKSHLPTKSRRNWQGITPPPSRMKPCPAITSYELEEAFVAMVKKEAFHHGKKIQTSKNQKSIKTVPGISDITESLPRINEKQLCFSSTIGRGHFGIVHEAILKDGAKVAVKTSLHGQHRILSESELMKEAYLMASMDHKNVIKLLGICKGSESSMLVLELAHLGNLKNFLRSNRETPELQVILALRQICDGMSYLETKAIVHRDLAARNVLLFKDWIAKISDFGLSRSMNSMSYYEFTGDKELPLKWYPPEVFNDTKFSHKSDVWSFGVTLWEGMSCGSDPYTRLSCSEYIDFINSGKRLVKPSKCSDGIYQVMLKCWQTSENNRPTFKELKKYLKTSYLTIIKP